MKISEMEKQDQIIIYKAEDGQTQIDVRLVKDTVWLSLNQLTELFQRDKSVISRHVNNVFKEGELFRNSVVANFATTAADGKTYRVKHFNLDIIISVGYRVKSKRVTQFRIWANKVLREYLIQGFVVNEKALSQKAEQLNELKRIVALQEKVISGYQLRTGEAEGLIHNTEFKEKN